MAIGRRNVSQEQKDRFIVALRGGNTIRDSAGLASIGESTIYAWIAEANSEEETRPDILEFVEALEQARSESVAMHVQNVRVNAFGRPAEYDADGNLVRAEVKPDWRASGWHLERSRPTDWSLTMRQQIEVTAAIPAEQVHDKLNEAVAAMFDGTDPDDPNVIDVHLIEGDENAEHQGTLGPATREDTDSEAETPLGSARSGSPRRSVVVRRTA